MATINTTERINFASSQLGTDYPDFLDIQVKSFQDFFQLQTKADERGEEGLYKTFMDNFPITDTRNQFVLEFLDYFVDPPRYSIQECIERGLTHSVPLKARLKLYCTDPEHEDFETIVQDVYLGTIPYMTNSGTFIINGAERVVVSQLHRSPGVFFGQSFHANGTKLYSARVIPFKGSWIEFATDINQVMYAYIDRKKKLPVTTLFRAIGFERDKDILEIFDLAEEIKVSKAGLKKVLGRKLAARVLKTWHEDFVDEDTGEVVSIERNEIVFDRDTIIEKEHIDEIIDAGAKTILLHKVDNDMADYAIIHNTLQKDPTNSEKEAVEHVYRQLRNAEPPDEETARGIIEKLFFSEQRYSLGEVGRFRMNTKLQLNEPIDQKVLTKNDIITIIKYLIELINSKAEVDDIDHLSNRRVRTVGEQLAGQFGVGLARMARTIRERMNVRDNEVFTPIDLINAKTLSSVINSFFGTNQLSQFMDQTNPLAEITHKRRLSALGPGGLSRERAGFEVRDVHYTHYGRLCPIETPEGPNIGLISSLAVFAKVNSLGFIETPYKKVIEGNVDVHQEHIYLSAEEEEGMKFAQSNLEVSAAGDFVGDKLISREGGDFPVVTPTEIDYMDVAPNQIASISASLIPFLEHDDANRALMGSNMMRQAVPLLRPESPIVGTGLERRVAKDSRILINAEGPGVIEYVDANKIRIKYDRSDEERLVSFESDDISYNLIKFRKTNQGTNINLKPIVKVGDRVQEGQVLCEGYATQKGELALGRNMKVAFMPWKGYNFEDAIVISEKVVREDIFTSIHIDEYSLDVRDTKLGAEELTNDIPNVSEEATKDLDENGMIRIGAEVNPGDILIGKITPKGESDPTPEEKLLRAIFGDKAGDVKDASLKASPSLRGVVINKKLFQRAVKDKTKRARDKEAIATLEASYVHKFEDLKDLLIEKLFNLITGKTSQGVFNDLGEEVLPKGKKFTQKMLNSVGDFTHLHGTWTTDKDLNRLVVELVHNYKIKVNDLQGSLRREKFTISVGDELPAGILKLAKIYVAKKRKLKVGDKMAGRHGNKGIIARIVRAEDMPFLEDGTPVDIVLNPLGVPSRMNIGQIYETVLGWAGQKLDQKYATPIFDGANIDQINALTDQAGIPRYGHTYLYDGGTGKRFDQPATVGIIYMIKLGHMIEDKMHARSIGPYSLITQQPLGGKAQFGGQRFGEMEVWALEAYGASSILREILTVKSDDVLGRAKTYEAIVKGETMPEPGLPESFNVLMHELKGLGLDVKLEE
ncbi:DNA-directed RNA polymerase subunit beta [Tenacibaculum finnmarkense genomovar finnmarkense]|uniref:DNA-directed RNA polymerase subunit beta n=3 Tax=Tenacibaculum TaxID=104267 RepID=A0AAP1RDZ1_9FLAO|nr:DNA-directed RNA polymerase subunit beta [Tenacibaculum finnmarkense]MBE7652269.1 DNA-directed RNA polymerase subunit beta [Tenacibaculum finnmarkense genomovar finnmarkense]MBE7659317.1 DNA-directed RNA polymerase subunit beta [Tenacibaculum finnmarkense genomovar finnmarkense]MBE7691468.1 DNA-directed RNA polymerase subunit beta [Tenacibaculum finnmarkense genomovar finnmarkense]MBE7694559.1 DNA-directed RNA polymerase subunit beta [Tenacibaculum finnmarkense genomovar finnmarkense]MCD840